MEPQLGAGAASLQPFARQGDEGEARWWLGSLALIKATSQDTNGAFCLVEVRENEGDTPLHVHHREDETFIVLEGEIEFEVGGEVIQGQPGTVLFGPRGIPHRYSVRRGPARMLFLLTPGGFEEFIRATSEPAPERRIPDEGEGLPDFEALPEIARRFGAELLD
ncbi:quercetin 2,3-dioxygenase [Geminicoccus roseus]|uniref:quercetin 2,3-dioxygenase n=1 Tax=Geminicoccus roseus TaxID=404900 RepID=UPI00040929DE|nr:quercetin 2,3-dioxygenase [Geminicoccus roseus]